MNRTLKWSAPRMDPAALPTIYQEDGNHVWDSDQQRNHQEQNHLPLREDQKQCHCFERREELQRDKCVAESAQTAKVQELQDKPQAKGLAAGSGVEMGAEVGLRKIEQVRR